MSRRRVEGEPEEETLGRAYDGRLMRRLLPFVVAHRRALAVAAVLFPVASAVDLVPPYLVKVAIDDHIVKGDLRGMGAIAGLFLLTLGAQYALRVALGYLLQWTGQHVAHDLRQALFAHVQRLPARFFDRTPVGRLMTRVLSDIEAIQELFTSGVVAVLADVLTLTGVVVVMLALDWRLAFVAFAAVPVLFGVAVHFRARARDAYRLSRTRIARVNAYLQESLVGMPVVQLFRRESAHVAEFSRLGEDYRQALYQRMGFDAGLYAIVELIGSVAIAGLVWWAAGDILAGTMTFGVLVAFMEYTHRFFLPIRDLSAKYAVMQSAMVSAERVFGLLDTPVEIASPAGGYRPGRRSGAGAGPALELRDVWFGYGSAPDRGAGDQWALRGLSLRVAAGERVAIVGATGAGKSTLARLLIRAYDVQQGAVLVDGVDVREWDLDALRRHVGLVLQDVVVFSGTIEENIRLGDAAVSPGAVEAAARGANLDAFVRSLPQRYAEEVRERGANLSHGQRQLLAIARALVYDPPALVLDEATSSVDPETERLVQSALDRLFRGRTSVVIAHRLSTIRRADRVLVLHRGRLVEEGTHAELLRRGGAYAVLHELSFGGGGPLATTAPDRGP